MGLWKIRSLAPGIRSLGMGEPSDLYNKISVPDWFVDNGCSLTPPMDYSVESLCRIHDYLYDEASVHLPFTKHEADKGLADAIGEIYESDALAATIYTALDIFGRFFYRKTCQSEGKPFTLRDKLKRKVKNSVFALGSRQLITRRIKRLKKETGLVY